VIVFYFISSLFDEASSTLASSFFLARIVVLENSYEILRSHTSFVPLRASLSLSKCYKKERNQREIFPSFLVFLARPSFYQ